MPTYISLITYTQKGIENIKESPNRLEAARQVFRAHGAELKAFYLTMGRFDIVIITEGPNDEAVTKATLTVTRGGAVRTETLRAFTEEEYRRIVAALP